MLHRMTHTILSSQQNLFTLNFAHRNNILEGQFVLLGHEANKLFVEILLDKVLEELNRRMIHLSLVCCGITLLALLLVLPLITGFSVSE